MNRALSFGIVILEELAAVIVAITLFGLLAIWIVSDWLWWLYVHTIGRIYIEILARWEVRNWGRQ